MAIIQSYPINNNVKDTDLLLGVTNIAPSGNPIYQTKSFRVSDVRGSGGGGGTISIGTANGLSLSGTVLSLGLASSSANGALSSANWTTFNNKQAALSGTGFVKASGSTISYDNSTYTPTLRTLTINGTTYDLSTDRSWTVGGTTLTLTTTGTSGPATLIGDVLNIPQYSGGGGTGSLEFNSTDLTVWNNGKSNVATNTSFGENVLKSNTIGFDNTCYGQNAGYFNTTGSQNTFIGRQAGQNNTTGVSSVGLGYGASGSVTTGDQNTSVGAQAGGSVTTGSSNVFLGRSAGYTANGASSGNVVIGTNAGQTGSGEYNNKLYIANASGTPLIGGDFSAKTVIIDGTITATSIIKSGGTSSQYLMADGSASAPSYGQLYLPTGIYYVPITAINVWQPLGLVATLVSPSPGFSLGIVNKCAFKNISGSAKTVNVFCEIFLNTYGQAFNVDSIAIVLNGNVLQNTATPIQGVSTTLNCIIEMQDSDEISIYIRSNVTDNSAVYLFKMNIFQI